MATGHVVKTAVHNISFIVNKDGTVIGAIKGEAYFDLADIMRSPHLHELYHLQMKVWGKESRR